MAEVDGGAAVVEKLDAAEGAGAAPDTSAAAVVAPEAGAVETPPAETAAEPAAWPDDWRDRFAKGDAALAKKLARFKAPENVLASYVELERKLSSKTGPEPLPADATEEQVAEWRAANGIPETPGGYLDALPEGLVIGDDDKPMIEGFAAKMHAANVKPEIVGEAVAWWHAEREATAAKETAADRQTQAATVEALKAEWGPEYPANINAVINFLDAMPDGVGKALGGAILADGTRLGDNATALKWLASLAQDANPAGTVAPAGDFSAQGVQSELSAIRSTMGDPSSPYHRDGGKTQKRYLELLESARKLNAR